VRAGNGHAVAAPAQLHVHDSESTAPSSRLLPPRRGKQLSAWREGRPGVVNGGSDLRFYVMEASVGMGA